jgi:hypothetical protein
MLINVLNLVVLTLTLGAVVWYTWITRRMQQDVANQVRELVHQRRLSIMPALVARVSGSSFELTNIGNGTAINIKINRVDLPFPTLKNSYITFQEIFLLHRGETCTVPYEEYLEGAKFDIEFGGLAHIDEKYAHGRVSIPIEFQDIEGNLYRQIVQMGKGGYRHGFVELISESEKPINE